MSYLKLLKSKGVIISLSDDKLKVWTKKGLVLDDATRDDLRRRKDELLNYLREYAIAGNYDAANEYNVAPRENARQERFPLSFYQEQLWLTDHLYGSAAYHIPVMIRLKGRPDIGGIEFAFRQIVERHEVLRTVIRSESDDPFQLIDAADAWRLEYHPAVIPDEETLNKYVKEAIGRPFDISKDCLLRSLLLTISADEYLLVILMHHIVSDGWSLTVLIKELVECYRSYREQRAPILQALKIQYADYANWQRNYFAGERIEKHLRYWESKLHLAEPLDIPTDYNRPSVQSFRGSHLYFNIDKELHLQLLRLSQSESVTLYMTLLSVFKVLLYRYSGQRDICVGSPIANRRHESLEPLIGFFTNLLVMRDTISGEPGFTELLQSVKETTLEAYANQDVPFEKVVERIVKTRDRSRSPLFQVAFVLQNKHGLPELDLGDVMLTQEFYDHSTSQYDLTFDATETMEGIRLRIEYCTDLYKASTIERMFGHYLELLRSAVADPSVRIGELGMLPETEDRQIRETFNDTARAYDREKTVIALFEEQARRQPDAIALVYAGEELSYRQLDERSNLLGHYLRGQGVGVGTLVPICMERGLDLVVGILGILKAGGAYVPIDPTYPRDRIEYMLENTGAGMSGPGGNLPGSEFKDTKPKGGQLVLSSEGSRDRLPSGRDWRVVLLDGDRVEIERESCRQLDAGIGMSDLAYVIYTSGSTGRPKGVMVEHRSVINYIRWASAAYVGNGGNGNFGLFTSMSFDLTVTSIFIPLLQGNRIYICDPSQGLESVLRWYLSEQKEIEAIKLTPSHINLIGELGLSGTGLKTVIVGGEALTSHQVSILRKLNGAIRIYNEYGPTESTVGCMMWEVPDSYGKIMIGRPIANTHVYILDREQRLVPVGVSGELYVGGAGLARGYLYRPELTAERFVADPLRPGERMYRTGDLGRWLPGGELEYLGRCDEQVKIRGYRVELGEIEQVLQESGQVRHCVVAARADGEGTLRLIGYVVTAGIFEKEHLMSWLRSRLPEYMVPSVVVELGELPLSANGKVDRRSLPDPEGLLSLQVTYEGPRNSTEERLCMIWSVVLHKDRIGIRDNFFERGGHSLLATQVLSLIRRELSVEPSIRDLFLYPTVAELAEELQSRVAAERLYGEEEILYDRK